MAIVNIIKTLVPILGILVMFSLVATFATMRHDDLVTRVNRMGKERENRKRELYNTVLNAANALDMAGLSEEAASIRKAASGTSTERLNVAGIADIIDKQKMNLPKAVADSADSLRKVQDADSEADAAEIIAKNDLKRFEANPVMMFLISAFARMQQLIRRAPELAGDVHDGVKSIKDKADDVKKQMMDTPDDTERYGSKQFFEEDELAKTREEMSADIGSVFSRKRLGDLADSLKGTIAHTVKASGNADGAAPSAAAEDEAEKPQPAAKRTRKKTRRVSSDNGTWVG